MTEQKLSHSTATPLPRASARPTIDRIFRKLKLAALGAVALGVLAIPASATNLTGCGTVTAGIFTLNQDLTTTSGVCLTITGLSSGYLSIDCQGHSITTTNSFGGVAFSLTSNTLSSVSFSNCTFRVPNYIASTYNINDNDTAGITFYNCTWEGSDSTHAASILVKDSPYVVFDYDTLNRATILFYGTTTNKSRFGKVTNSSGDLTGVTGTVGHTVRIQSNYVEVSHNSFTGVTTGDTIITLIGNNAYVGYNTFTTNPGIAVELAGSVSNTTIENNYSAILGAFTGCLHECDINNLTIQYNTHIPSGGNNEDGLVYFPGSDSGGNLINVSITGNSYAVRTTHHNYMANSVANTKLWNTISNVTLTGNNFGPSATVYFQGTSGYSDGGSNYCSSASPSAITCH